MKAIFEFNLDEGNDGFFRENSRYNTILNAENYRLAVQVATDELYKRLEKGGPNEELLTFASELMDVIDNLCEVRPSFFLSGDGQ